MSDLNKNIFCNSPWYELHVYWDGSLGFCCAENHKIYQEDQKHLYNLKNLTIKQWYNSEPMKIARMSMFGNQPNSFCVDCYKEEALSHTSRRTRSNQKSVIFKTVWHESFQQSPGFQKFMHSKHNQGDYDGMPIDMHIDLGNFCNLTCKMCGPWASSSIAVQHVKWGIEESKKYVGADWTQDQVVWDRTVEEISEIKNLKNVHFMGGETLITPRFENFVDYMIAKKRFDLNFSFVTNGTIWKQSLLDKLKKFNRIGIEVSIETLTEHNAYQRQGTDTQQVLTHLQKYAEFCDGIQRTLTVRPAISALTIGYYWTLLQYCLDNRVIIKSLICDQPKYYDAMILPRPVKSLYLEKYQDFLDRNVLHTVDVDRDYNESDPNEIDKIIKSQVDRCINILRSPAPTQSDTLLTEMVAWCKRWDQIHGYDARYLYPEWASILDEHGY